MAVNVPPLQPNLKVVDEEGNVSQDFTIVLQQLIRALRDHEARLVALEP